MSEDTFLKEKEGLDLFSKINQRYLPFWPLFVVTTSFSLIVSIIYLRSQIPVYVASAKVLLKDPNKTSDSKLLDALNIFGDKKIVDNEIVVLKSRNLMEAVVKDLDLYATVYNRGKVKIEELYGNNSPLKFQATDKSKLNVVGNYPFIMDWKDRIVKIAGRNVPFDSVVNLSGVDFILKINPYYNTNLKGKNYFVQINPSEYTAGSIASTLRIVPISSASTVLTASMDIGEPEKGKDILTKLFKHYNDNTIEDKTSIGKKTLSFVEDRLAYVTRQLDTVERNIVAYKSKEHLFDISNQAQNYLVNVRDFDRKNTDIDLQLDLLNEIHKYIINKGSERGVVPAISLISDPILSKLLSNLYDYEFQLDKAKNILGNQNDIILTLQSNINKVKKDISENITNIRKTLIAERNFNNGVINQNTGLLYTVPQKERGLLDISRNEDVKKALYTYLLQKREETAISKASTVEDLKVIETATAYGPIAPVARSYYLFGLTVGFLLSIFLILIKEQLNRKLLFRQELEEKTQVPVIGELVQVSSNDPIVITEGKRSVIAEQFRSVRTNLGFTGISDNRCKTILITSSISGEGKSFVAVNLGISFSLIDKKVALLEMDLRKPRLSKLMKISRDPGISNYLVGSATIDEIIKPTNIKNVSVVSSGPIPPNPAELILRPEFKIMLDQLKAKFDYLIIDTAPIGPVSDAQLITEYTDSTLYVVRHDYTPRIFLRMIRTVADQKKYKNMSLIFNGLKRRGISLYNSDYGGYDYGYGYGYGYGGGYAYGDAYYEKSKKPNGFINKIKSLFS